MPPGAVSLDDIDLDQVSIDYVLECAKKGDGILKESYYGNLIFGLYFSS